jgi:phosphoenolpyruvate carboxykinase (GTP)
MASERTSAQFGKLGEVRFDPMAMLPFCGYNMGQYFRHWLNMGKQMKKPPRIFLVNWCRVDKHGKFIWPGFGENLRILEWILKRCNNEVGAVKTPLGYMPKIEDINTEGLNLSKEKLQELFSIDKEEWREETKRQRAFLGTLKGYLPKEIWQEHYALIRRLK